VFLLLEYGVKMQKQSIQRKIIETKGSYYINIPKQVATNLQLKKGEQVAIYPNSNGFLVGLLTVYSIGYEKRTIEELLSILKQHKITQVIDVRERAFSRVPAYRKAKLEKALQDSGIFYYNLNQLGAPSSLRKALNKGINYNEFFHKYKEHLTLHYQEYELLKKVISTAPTVLLCYERDPEFCHRSVITSELKRDGYHIVHL